MRIYLAGVVLGMGESLERFCVERERSRLFTFHELSDSSPIKTNVHFFYYVGENADLPRFALRRIKNSGEAA